MLWEYSLKIDSMVNLTIPFTVCSDHRNTIIIVASLVEQVCPGLCIKKLVLLLSVVVVVVVVVVIVVVEVVTVVS